MWAPSSSSKYSEIIPDYAAYLGMLLTDVLTVCLDGYQRPKQLHWRDNDKPWLCVAYGVKFLLFSSNSIKILNYENPWHGWKCGAVASWNMIRKSTSDSTRADVFVKQEIKTCGVKCNTSNEYTKPFTLQGRGDIQKNILTLLSMRDFSATFPCHI